MDTIQLGVTELSVADVAAVNGGGATYEYGKSIGQAWYNAVQNDGLIDSFGMVTDFFYGNW
jgi:hypothetical protein